MNENPPKIMARKPKIVFRVRTQACSWVMGDFFLLNLLWKLIHSPAIISTKRNYPHRIIRPKSGFHIKYIIIIIYRYICFRGIQVSAVLFFIWESSRRTAWRWHNVSYNRLHKLLFKWCVLCQNETRNDGERR